MKIYQVFHAYDVDGGFGDAVPNVDLIETFVSKEDAKDFVERFANPHIYDKPYASLECGNLYIRESEALTHNDYSTKEFKEFWWNRPQCTHWEFDEDDEDEE